MTATSKTALPFTAGEYTIREALGSGGTGEVFIGFNPLGQRFAVKRANPKKISSEVISRLRLESELMQAITHPHVVKGEELFEFEGTLYFVMEYVDGGSLHERKEKVSPRTMVQIAIDVARGLSEIHGRGVVHRDLKPANILLTKSGNAKLSDFGIALANPDSALTLDGFMVGTPRYLPPEYIETGTADVRGDLYSLGVILYECLAKDFSVSPQQRMIPAVVNLHKLPSGIPPELRQVIEKATKKSVISRFQTANELACALEAVLPLCKENLLQRLNFIGK